jgi:ATP-dependent helicase Lhr and Lhr-like helicase
LRRYGVVFRDLLARESLVQSWRDLLVQYRRMELKGEVRGGRFVSGFVGEQFALPEAVESLRALRKSGAGGVQEVKISAVDPLNLAGIILPGPRVPAVTTNFLILTNGVVVRTMIGQGREAGAPVFSNTVTSGIRSSLPATASSWGSTGKASTSRPTNIW